VSTPELLMMLRESGIPGGAGSRKHGRAAPGRAALGPAGQGEIGAEQVKPPGAAGRVGAGHVPGIAYRREPALHPDPGIAGAAEPSRRGAIRSRWARFSNPSSHLASSDKAPARPYLAPAGIDRQQNPRIGFDLRLQRGDGFPANV
jgi:hypothetical protein